MVQGWIENESTKIGGTSLNLPALDFQQMTELKMGVRELRIDVKRFSIGVFSF
jgi:hypothetical protein